MNTRLAYHPTVVPSEAWAFILARSAQIDRLSARFFRLLGPEDRCDARSDFIARVVEQYPRLRLEGALNTEMVVVTWLGWQARAVQQTYCRSYRKHEKNRDRDHVLVQVQVEDGNAREVAATEGNGTPEAVVASLVAAEAQAIVEQLYGLATPKQREAMLTVLLDMAPQEMRRRFGLASNARNERLYDLRDRATRAGIALN